MKEALSEIARVSTSARYICNFLMQDPSMVKLFPSSSSLSALGKEVLYSSLILPWITAQSSWSLGDGPFRQRPL